MKIHNLKHARILVTGHSGLVGSAIIRAMKRLGYNDPLTLNNWYISNHDEGFGFTGRIDLTDQREVDSWFDNARPDYVIHAAGKVGGIQANIDKPADFLYDNLLIHANVLKAAHETDVAKLLYLGSSCIYPRNCQQPIREDSLLTGSLEPTNEYYAIAKISGVKLCEAYRKQYGCNFISAMPTNLYGPYDNFDLRTSHLVPALIRKFHEAKVGGYKFVKVWGSGKVRRELMYVDDLAEACLFLLGNYDDLETINVGTGIDLTVGQIADIIKGVVYPEAIIEYEGDKEEGTPRKLLNVQKINKLGWKYKIELRAGIEMTYRHYVAGIHSNIGCF